MKTDNIRKNLSMNVKIYRFKAGFTQEQLAELCELSPRYISDIENCNGNIPIDMLENIANKLDIEPFLLIKPQKHKELPKRVNMKN